MPGSLETVSIVVQSLSAVGVAVVDVDVHMNVLELKQLLEEYTWTPAVFQRLLLGSEELLNSTILVDAGFHVGTEHIVTFIRVSVDAWILESFFIKSEFSNMAIVRFILDSDVHLNMKDRFGATLLHRAAHNGDVAVCTRLLHDDRKFDPRRFTEINARDRSGKTALHHAALNDHVDVCKLLMIADRFTQADAIDNQGKTALNYADQHSLLETSLVLNKRA
eukprot:TRINITY_DN29700_c0_g6_i1.p1 TRINITY_DN29700_c0_g6~~TRINITY_DN29700_c0_g6_i1.p1  ORF type:complete len:221 (-),score=21.52 TRINITY_DN29700_c0_g6_i1:110-772(-)